MFSNKKERERKQRRTTYIRCSQKNTMRAVAVEGRKKSKSGSFDSQQESHTLHSKIRPSCQ